MRAVIVLLMLLACNVTIGQTLDWSAYIEHATTSTDPNDRIAAYDVVEDDMDNVLICGGHRGEHDFDPGPGEFTVVSGDKGNVVNIYDIFVAKYDPAGALIWVINIGGNAENSNATSLDVDDQGNVYVTGKFDGTFDFDPGVGVYNMTSTSGDGDLFVAKYDPAGNFIWSFVIEGTTNFRQSGFDLDVNSTAGKMVIGARLDDPVDIDPVNPANTVPLSTGGEDAGILAYDLDGNFIYGFNYNDPSGGGWVAVEMDDAGNVFGFLSVYSFTDLDPGPTGLGVMGPVSILLKLDPAGNYAWHKELTGGAAITGGLELDPCDNIIIAGSVSGNAANTYDLGEGAPAGILTGDGSQSMVFVAKYTNDGNFIWLNSGNNNGAGSTRIGSGGVNGYYNGGLSLDKDGDIYIAGSTNASLDFGALTVAGSNYRGYVLKMDRNGVYDWVGDVSASGFGLTWLMNISIGQDYDVNIYGKSSNEVIGPFGGTANGITAQNAYTYNISQIILPPDPQLDLAQSSQCTSDTVDFDILNEMPDSVFWDFGDPGSGANNMATGYPTQHVFSGQGTYDVQAILYFGCIPDTLDTLVTVNSSIIPLDLGNDTIICAGDLITLDVTTGMGATYLWNDMSTNPTLDVTTSGVFGVEVSVLGCLLEDSIEVTVAPLPDAGNDSTDQICITGQTDIDVTSYLSSAQVGVWSEVSTTPSGSFDPLMGELTMPIVNGTYEFQYDVDGVGSCAGDMSVITLEITNGPDAGNDSTSFFCGTAGTILDLNNFVSTVEIGSWSEVSGTPSGQFTAANGMFDIANLTGNYLFDFVVPGTAACVGTDDIAQIAIELEAQELAGLDNAMQLCVGDPDLDLETGINGNSTLVGTWFDAATGAAVTPIFSSTNTPGVYAYGFVVGVAQICQDTALITVELGLNGNAGVDTQLSLCSYDDPVDLIAEMGADQGGVWFPDVFSATNIFDPSVGPPGTFSYTASGSAFCASDTSILELAVIDLTSLEVFDYPTFCINADAADLQATFTGGVWSGNGITNTGTGTFVPMTAGSGSHVIVYTIDSSGCTNTATTTLNVAELPFIDLPDTLTVCADEFLILSADVLVADEVYWSTGDTGENIQVFPSFENVGETEVYTVFATNGCGAAEESISLNVEDCEIYVFVPNAFTPDGDEHNQTFVPNITGSDESSYEMRIYNRWGEVIFATNDLAYGWDGTYNGRMVQDGVYTWKIRYKNLRVDEHTEIHGHVSIIK